MNSPIKLLYVDDDKDWHQTIEEVLSKQGYEISYASSYNEAIDCIRQSTFHIALLDKRLNDSDPHNEEGLEIAKHIKSLGEGTRVIVFTAFGDIPDVNLAYRELGVSNFLEKDTKNPEIVAAIKELAEEAMNDLRRPVFSSKEILDLREEALHQFLGNFSATIGSTSSAQKIESFAKRLAGEYRPLLPDRNPAKLLSLTNHQILQCRFWSKMLGFPIAVCFGTYDGMKLALESIDSDEKLGSSLPFGKKIKEVFDRDVFPDFGGVVFELRNTPFEEFKL